MFDETSRSHADDDSTRHIHRGHRPPEEKTVEVDSSAFFAPETAAPTPPPVPPKPELPERPARPPAPPQKPAPPKPSKPGSGLPGLRFCHASRFMITADTNESAIAACRIADGRR